MLSGAFGTMAMVNYPYPISFIFPMPAWPVNASCAAALAINPSSDEQFVQSIFEAAQIYYNYTKTPGCFNASNPEQGGLDTNGWAVLACNEMVMPIA